MFRFVFYAALLVLLYLLGKGIYNGQITEQSTVEQVVENVDNNAAQMLQKGQKELKK